MDNKKKISILIPTYNRSFYLSRLLNFIYDELNRLNLYSSFEIIVSNNASTDETKKIVNESKLNKFNFKAYHQNQNIGFDKNVEFLYSKASSDYVWFFADDDIIFENTLLKVSNVINTHHPSVLLYSFQQPIGSLNKTFNYDTNIKIFNDKKNIIENICKYPKLSIYIFQNLKSINLSKIKNLYNSKDYFFVYLCLSVNENINNKKIAVISDFLASCDENFNQVRFSASSYLNYYQIFFHPYIFKDFPNMYINQKKQCYVEAIHFMYSIISKQFSISDKLKFVNDIKDIRFHSFLFLRPKTFIKFCIIKIYRYFTK